MRPCLFTDSPLQITEESQLEAAAVSSALTVATLTVSLYMASDHSNSLGVLRALALRQLL